MSTYVISDIHGHGNLFHKLLEKIGFSEKDTMYILGDVVDRGPDGIDLLREIMHTPNMVLLMGNHEDILLRYITMYGYGVNMRTWGLLGNRATLNGYNALTDLQQRELGAFLQNAPSHKIVNVNGQTYYLVHAFPSDNRDDELWARPQWDAPNPYPGYRVIVGHTPTIYMGRTHEEADQYEEVLFRQGRHMEIYHGSNFICVDCGCGTAERVGALACLRLEDMTEFYCKDNRKKGRT